MGRELLAQSEPFRAKIEECDALFREFGKWSLIEELSRDQSSSKMEQAAIAQPAIFALQVALAALWQSYGVSPVAVVGHSVGEVAAAHVAGVLTLREAARIVFHRGRAMGSVPDTGRMLAAALTATQAQHFAADYGAEVVVAAYNSPSSVTFSGDPAPLKQLRNRSKSAASTTASCRSTTPSTAARWNRPKPICWALWEMLKHRRPKFPCGPRLPESTRTA
jgi:acyl transferase domain-containing protein